jgi:tRNA pseudouridine13 synthase
MNSVYPFLTSELQAIGGAIKAQPQDFCVEEIPLHEPSGEGTHIYFQIEKCDITTMDAVAAIAKALGRAKKDVCVAGQKDARAIARQWMSVDHIKAEAVEALNIPKIKVLRITRNKTRLKAGELRANAFTIKLRETAIPAAEAAAVASMAMELLEGRGVPNYYGPQRFGSRADSHLLGECVVKGKMEEFADLFLGGPVESEARLVALARQRYDRGDYEGSLAKWPWNFADQRRAMRTLIETGGDKRKAYNVIDKNLKKFLVSAFQSELFNRVLASRMPDIDKLLAGDIAYKHQGGAMFAITDAAAEQSRCQSFEISPTGPLIGLSMRRLDGDAGAVENPIIEQAALNERDLEQLNNFVRGGRRPLRFRPRDCRVKAGRDERGEYVEFAFELDSGCYATTLLREICKREI